MIMELSNRLETIASFVTEGYVVADIGTDHGYIPIYLTSNGNCPRAYAMDVNKEPLSRAKTHIEEENAGEVVSCILSDGLHELPQDDVDSIVIAGMGGDLVVRILEQDFDKLANVKELILSPQSHLERVRHFLNDHGFRILEEEFLKEDGVFVFDMNSHYKYKEILACNTFAEDREDASFIWDNFYDEEERINEYQLSLFIQNEQGTYNKYEELHLQKAYEQEEVVSFLYEAGFSSVRVLDAETMDEVKEDTQRLYSIAKGKEKR